MTAVSLLGAAVQGDGLLRPADQRVTQFGRLQDLDGGTEQEQLFSRAQRMEPHLQLHRIGALGSRGLLRRRGGEVRTVQDQASVSTRIESRVAS